MTCVMIQIFCMVTPVIVTKNLALPVPVALPHSVENSIISWASYLYQSTTGFTLISVHISVDCTFFGLLLLMKRHQEVLKYRIQHSMNFPTDSEIQIWDKKVNFEKKIEKLIEDHDSIYK